MLQVRSFAKEKASTGRYGGSQDQVVGWGLRSARASGFFFGFNSLVGTGSIVFVLWYGARQVSLSSSAPMCFLSHVRHGKVSRLLAESTCAQCGGRTQLSRSWKG